MYKITLHDGIEDINGTLIHSPYVGDLKINWNVGLVLDGVSDLTFEINPKSPAWNLVKPLKSLIKVIDTKKNKVVFEGRVLKPSQKMNQNGSFSIEYICESKMAYLNDSYQRYGKYKNVTISYLLNVILNNHNAQVESHKQFKLGNVTVTDSNDAIYRFLDYEKTFDTIQDKLVKRLGGHIIIREEPDGMYIDYLKTVGKTSSTSIRLRSNLKDLQKEIDPTEIVTRLVVLGSKQEIRHGIIDSIEDVNGQNLARVEIQDEKAELLDISTNVLPSGVQVGGGITIYGISPYWTFENGIDSDVPEENTLPRLTMKSVNGGKDYLDNTALINEFGVIESSIIYDDINTPSTLLLRANQFFTSQLAAKVSYNVTPLDLSVIDSNFESLEIGDWYYVINEVLAINELLQIIDKQIDGQNPHMSKITLGQKVRTLSQYQVEAKNKMKVYDTIQATVNSQSKTIVTLKTNVTAATTKITQITTELEKANLTGMNQTLVDLNQVVLDLNTSVDSFSLTINTYDFADMEARITALENGTPTDPEPTSNLFNMNTATAVYIDSDGIDKTSTELDKTSDFILVDTLKDYRYTQQYNNTNDAVIDGYIHVAFYDTTKVFISHAWRPQGSIAIGATGQFIEDVLTFPANTVYMRIGGNAFSSATLVVI